MNLKVIIPRKEIFFNYVWGQVLTRLYYGHDFILCTNTEPFYSTAETNTMLCQLYLKKLDITTLKQYFQMILDIVLTIYSNKMFLNTKNTKQKWLSLLFSNNSHYNYLVIIISQK